MITNAINIIGVMAEEKKLDFVVKMQPNLPKYIIGDERRLEQVLINILSNSVKFTESGSVELAISSEYVNNHVRLNFKIIDTGKGMKSDTINTVFEAFQQEDNSISRKYGGTGLGLYISKEFIERMNGEIRVKSTVDVGTEFEFYTIHRITDGMKEENTVPIVTTMAALIGMKVLLVEDNDINQLIIRDILHEMGLKVVITNNGAEAMEVINPRFDFVLMDIQMPVMNGIMAIRLIKQSDSLKNLPIIALTANVMPEQIESYYAEGFDGYCSKPIMVNELAQTLTLMYEKYHKHK
jgi:CheY-like chemotaxis protein